MPRFKNRIDAGHQLADKLSTIYKPTRALVIAMPRGGVILGRVIADQLKLPLDVVCPRKIASPIQPEYALGAVTEDGTLILPARYKQSMHEITQQAYEEAKRRAALYRNNRPPPNYLDKQVIIVDDGLATGLTMQAAVSMITGHGASEIILAIPCAPPASLAKFQELVDQIVCLKIDEAFMAVSQYYESFPQVSEEEVIRLLSYRNS